MPHAADIYAGQKLRQVRHLLGVSQDELGKALGISFQQVQKYEKGTNRISVSMLDEICHRLKVEPSVFFHTAEADRIFIEERQLISWQLTQDLKKLLGEKYENSNAK